MDVFNQTILRGHARNDCAVAGAPLNLDVLDEILVHLAQEDLVRLATVNSTWHAAVYRRLHLSLRFASAASAQCFISSSRARYCDQGTLVSSVTKARAAIRGYSLDGATAPLLPDLAALAPQLRELTIHSDAHVYDDVLLECWATRPYLRDIRLRSHVLRRIPVPVSSTQPAAVGLTLTLSPSDALLQNLAAHSARSNQQGLQHRASLRTLELGGRFDVSDAGLVPFLRSCGAQLQVLELGDCPKLTARSLRAVALFCPALEELTLRRSSGSFSDSRRSQGAIAALDDGLIDEADEANLSNVDIHPLELVARRCHRLRRLVLSELCSPLPFAPSFRRLPDLDSLTLTRVSLRPSFLSAFPRLRRLTISACRIVGGWGGRAGGPTDDVSVLPVGEWRELETLSLLASGMTVGQMRQLFASAPRLRKVSLDGVSSSTTSIWPYRMQLPTPPATPTSARSTLPPGFDKQQDSYFSSMQSALEVAKLSQEIEPYADHNVLSSQVPNDVILSLFSDRIAPSLESLALFGFTWQSQQPSSPEPRQYAVGQDDALSYLPPFAARPFKRVAQLRDGGRFWLEVAWSVARGLLLLPPSPLPSIGLGTWGCSGGSRIVQRKRIEGQALARLTANDVQTLKQRNLNLVSIWV